MATQVKGATVISPRGEIQTAVPHEFCDEMALVGPAARIRERYRAWADSGITGLTISTDQPDAMELIASLAGDVR